MTHSPLAQSEEGTTRWFPPRPPPSGATRRGAMGPCPVRRSLGSSHEEDPHVLRSGRAGRRHGIGTKRRRTSSREMFKITGLDLFAGPARQRVVEDKVVFRSRTPAYAARCTPVPSTGNDACVGTSAARGNAERAGPPWPGASPGRRSARERPRRLSGLSLAWGAGAKPRALTAIRSETRTRIDRAPPAGRDRKS
jgi:hypothetical protein